jgi:hypothetical protein
MGFPWESRFGTAVRLSPAYSSAGQDSIWPMPGKVTR